MLQNESGEFKEKNEDIVEIFLHSWNLVMTAGENRDYSFVADIFSFVITENENNELINIPTAEEITNVTKSLNSWKASGPHEV